MVLVRLDAIDPVELDDLVTDAWLSRAPRLLVSGGWMSTLIRHRIDDFGRTRELEKRLAGSSRRVQLALSLRSSPRPGSPIKRHRGPTVAVFIADPVAGRPTDPLCPSVMNTC